MDYSQTLALFRSQELATPTEKIVGPTVEIPDTIEELEALFTVECLVKNEMDLGSEIEAKFSTRQKVAILYSKPLVCNLDQHLADDAGVDTEESYRQSLCEGVIKVCLTFV